MTVIKFNELLDFEKHPTRGKLNYNDSKVVDLEFTKDEIEHVVKCHLDIKYNRWYYPQTEFSPEEDECSLLEVNVEPIKGFKNENVRLTDKELVKLIPILKSKLIFE